MTFTSTRLLKPVAAILWVSVLVFAYVTYLRSGLTLHELPRVIRGAVADAGVWGPVSVLVAYALRSMLLLPTTIPVLVTGALFGPVWGTALNMAGELLSATFSFYLARFFGRWYVREHEWASVRKYDELMISEGFMTVLMMRLLFFPFDVVNYLSGMSGVAYRQYALASFIGFIPSTVTFSVLGDGFGNPRSLALFAVLLAAMVLLAALLRRSRWVRKKFLNAKTHESVF